MAALLSTAGWAAAAQRVIGDAWIVTPDGVVDPSDVRQQGSAPQLTSAGTSRWRRRVPTPLKTALKDLRTWRQARGFHVDPNGPWGDREVAFVWQRHELFHRAGLRLAVALGVPSVVFVPATLVWQADRWGVRRPGWGRWLERRGEGRALRAADVVACGTEEVAEQVRRLGVRAERVVITPTGVDLDLFVLPADVGVLRRELGLEDRFVVGWVGSFRRFHAVEQAIEAMAALPGAVLLLVGDGPERARLEALARERDVAAVCTGTVAHQDLPAHLALMDAALVLAGSAETFHYSPLKLAEYLAAGLPVVAPAVEQLADRLTDGVDAVLVPPGDVGAIVDALAGLRDDPARRARIGQAARATAEAHWSWDHEVRHVLGALP